MKGKFLEMDLEAQLSVDDSSGKSTEFVCAEHGSSLLKALYMAWTNKEYCDITLKVGKDSIRTHRLVLTALSEYFKALLHMDINGKKDEAELHEVDFDSLCQILAFGYTGKIEVSMDTVASLFIASTYLQVVFVKDSCEKFLLDNIDKDNCVRVWCLADQYNAMALDKKAMQTFSRDFEYICNTEDFISMVTVKMLLRMLQMEGLVISEDGLILNPKEQEMILFRGVLQYTDKTMCSIDDTVSLLRAVRLPLLDSVLVTEHLSKYPRLFQDKAVENLMNSVKTFQENSERSQETYGNWVLPRTLKVNGYIYSPNQYGVGGQDGTHFFLRSNFGVPRPKKEAVLTSVDVHLRYWSPHSQRDPIVGGLTFRYSDNTILTGGLEADSHNCTKVESFKLQESEYITRVIIHSGWMMDSIKFETNLGKSYGPWGGDGGGERICVSPNGRVGCLHSFAGVDINSGGCSAVHRVRLGWATMEDDNEKLEMKDLYQGMRLRPHSDTEDEDIADDSDGSFFEDNTDED